jgi:hypothetical protein
MPPAFSLSMLLSSLGTINARKAELATEVIVRLAKRRVLRPLFAEWKSDARFYGLA